MSDCSRIFSIAAFDLRRELRDLEPDLARAIRLRKNRVGLAIHLLQQEIELLAALAARIAASRQLRGVDFQPRQLFADVAAVGQDRRLLRQSLRIDLRSLEQLSSTVPTAGFERRPPRRADLFHLFGRRGDASVVGAHLRRDLRAFARPEHVQLVERDGQRIEQRRFGALRRFDR